MGAEEGASDRVSRRWLDLIGVVIGALLLALVVQWILVKPYKIPSPSMMPTLVEGQRVFVDRLSDHFSNPQRGQIVVFHPPAGATRPAGQELCGVPRREDQICPRPTPGKADVTYIKRVMGVPGDRIEVRGGHVIRNGRAVAEPYARMCDAPICNLPEYMVPKGSYFMMGDNRGDSSDSRFWGAVPRSYVIGRAFATYWPPKRIGGL
jgi:signal peptidase I